MEHGTLKRARGESVRVESLFQPASGNVPARDAGVFRVHASASQARRGAGGWLPPDVGDVLRVGGEVRTVTAVLGSDAGWAVVETAPQEPERAA